MKNTVIYSQHTHTYMALRRAVGIIGLSLPFILMFGNFLIFKGDITLPSISRYYYSDMRDVFVGSLCAIALFMFFYSGYGKRDDWAGNLAGFFALGVAIFPTTEAGPRDWIGAIHNICAALLFLTLSVFSLFLFPRKRAAASTAKKPLTDKIQIVCGLIMVTCVISVTLYMLLREKKSGSRFIFVAETVALVAFGVSWLSEGRDLKKELI